MILITFLYQNMANIHKEMEIVFTLSLLIINRVGTIQPVLTRLISLLRRNTVRCQRTELKCKHQARRYIICQIKQYQQNYSTQKYLSITIFVNCFCPSSLSRAMCCTGLMFLLFGFCDIKIYLTSPNAVNEKRLFIMITSIPFSIKIIKTTQIIQKSDKGTCTRPHTHADLCFFVMSCRFTCICRGTDNACLTIMETNIKCLQSAATTCRVVCVSVTNTSIRHSKALYNKISYAKNLKKILQILKNNLKKVCHQKRFKHF